MSRRTVTVLLTAVSAAAALAVPAPAAASTLLSARDKAGDVKIFTETDGLPKAQRRSIDILRFRVADPRDNKVRFTVGIKEIIRKPKFDQMFFVALDPPPKSDATWQGQIGFTSKGKDGYATVYDADDTDWCNIDGVTRKPAKDKVSIDVPRRCLPEGRTKVRLDSFTGQFRSDAPTYSHDRLFVPDVHDLTP